MSESDRPGGQDPVQSDPSPTAGSPIDQNAQQRKHELFARTAPALVGSIADAIAIKEGDVFLLTRPDGSIPFSDNVGLGLYYHDCRFLDGWEIRVNGQSLYAIVATAETGFSAIFELTNPILFDDSQHTQIPPGGLGLRSQVLIGEPHLVNNLLTISNYTPQFAKISVDLAFSAHFEDIFNVRGFITDHPGTPLAPTLGTNQASFHRQGADGHLRTTRLAFLPAPEKITADPSGVIQVHYELSVPPEQPLQLAGVIQVEDGAPKAAQPVFLPPAAEQAKMEAVLGQSLKGWLSQYTSVSSENMLFDRALERSLLDLRMLQTELEQDRFFSAGLPWFGTLFGRDSLIAAYQMLAFNPAIAEKTLRVLARHQGTVVNAWRDEQPGKILHELRVGELANLNVIPQGPYYGSVDSTPLFLIILGAHARWTGRLDLFRELQAPVEAALAWIAQYGDLSKNGYLEYQSQSTGQGGLINQGWKDSGNAVVNADGQNCTPPIALVEVQGYVYLAEQLIADLYERAGDRRRATQLRAKARALYQQFNADFWQEDLNFYALALQKDKQPARVRASNPGQALWTGIVAPEHAQAVVDTLMSPTMFTGWGIRTLAENDVSYNPVGYHVGGVWPHDCSLIAAGFRRVGRDAEALKLFTGIFEAATKFRDYRLPELFSGFSRAAYRVPVQYPTACHPQAWGAGALPFFLTVCLGIEPNAWDRQLRLVRPRLPSWLGWVILRGLRVGDATVDLRVEQMNGGAAVAVLKKEGALTIDVVEE
ncbi:MAG TPA: glycogen debranching N-terminal domain-containing protein [Chloroflexota bacterium]|nr:glycogen debranching N-terminal domain-containing protein [Chloroflexota bacterium]